MGQTVDVIKYEGDNSTFIWKHPCEDFTSLTQLIVHESQEAIFFKDGQALDTFGPGRYTLEAQKLPLLAGMFKLPTGEQETFHSEVYFINKTTQMAIKWGTPDKVRFIDPLTGVPLELGASGEMNIAVDNGRKLLIKLVGTMKGIAWGEGAGFTQSLQSSFRPLIANAVKTNLPQVIKNESIDLLEIDEKLDVISANMKEKIQAGFEEYGLTIPQFYVNTIVLPENDPNFKRIKELHTITLQTRVYQAEATVQSAQAQSEAQIKIAQAQSEAQYKMAQAQSEAQYRVAQEQTQAAIAAAHRQAELERQTTETEIARREAERTVIQAQAEAEAQRMAGMTEAEIMRAKGYTERDVIQADVQKAYAEGIGNMGPAISAGGGGSSIVGDMLGLGVGMAAAGVVAPQIGNMMQNIGVQTQSPAQPMMQPMSTAQGDTWNCTCGQTGVTGNFCNNCGNRRPAPEVTWDCSCGAKGVTGNFCNNCGAKKPEPVSATWDCSCGAKGVTGNFCNNCGKKRGE